MLNNTKKNCQALANLIIDSMDGNDILEWARDAITKDLMDNQEYFREECDNYDFEERIKNERS